MFSITEPDQTNAQTITTIINNKAKPPGSLGQLEALAFQLALLHSQEQKIIINKPTMLVFAGDHGIARHQLSIAPPEVTQQMVHTFAIGGAAVNSFSRVSELDLKIIDCGILKAVEHAAIINQRLGEGTADFTNEPAMTAEQLEQGFAYGKSLIATLANNGTNVVAIGEMGIGNTTTAAALLAALLDWPVEQCVGRGTGIDDATLLKKQQLIAQAIAKHRAELSSPKAILQFLGGFEIVQMAATILAAAEKNMSVVIDGFISTVAALVAVAMYPQAKQYLIFAHLSNESAHKQLLAHLEATPLLTLGMRLGEGSGAALAMPLLHAAAEFYNTMLSLEDIGVEI